MSVAQIVTGQLNMTANFQQTQTAGNINTNGSLLNELIAQAYQYVNSTGVNYGVDQLFAKQFTLASTTATIHLETATQNDPFGNTLAMLRIREIIVVNTNTTLGQDLKVEGSASNGVPWIPPSTSPLFARAGGTLRIGDPLSFGGGVGNVIGATTDGITFDSGSNTIVFNVLILGCSVA